MTGHEEAIVIAGRREDWPGGPRTLTARTPMPMALLRLKPLLLLGLVLWCQAPAPAQDRQAEPLPSAGQAGHGEADHTSEYGAGLGPPSRPLFTPDLLDVLPVGRIRLPEGG